MLKTLQKIVQAVSNASSLLESLQIMAKEVRRAINADACAIFILDVKGQHYLLMASEGLKPGMNGKLRIHVDEGLVGLVGRREEPINLPNAQDNPHYRYFPETGEEVYKSFLGVPIIHQRKVLGIVAVRQCESRRFEEWEEALLVTISAQLAVVIAHADLSSIGMMFSKAKQTHLPDTLIEGLPGAPGVAIGQAVIIYPLADLEAIPDRRITDIDAEIKLFEHALANTREDIRQLRRRIAVSLPPEERALFDAYSKMLAKESLGQEVVNVIRQGHWAQGALRIVINQHVNKFAAMDDEYLRERALDIKDLGRRVLANLQSTDRKLIDFPDQTILVGEEVTASALAEVPPRKLAGIVAAKGSKNSHVAILARALNIPTVMGVDTISLADIEGRELVLDGYHGRIFISPSERVREEFLRIVEEEKELYAGLAELKDMRAETPDGQRMLLMVNTGLVADIPSSLNAGSDGVGLYRTEVPFMIRDRFPSEEEQRVIYRQLLEAFAPSPVVMRTLDIGGDKNLPYFPIKEDNPFLGWRGIRITLDHPEIFLVQLRAMFKASDSLQNLQILLPMIVSLSEVEEALRLVDQAYHEVLEEGYEIVKPNLGIMIETPAAVYQAPLLAAEVDFLSVGSNDLIQYMLAVDRNNAHVASLYDSLHPAVLMALEQVVNAAHMHGKTASICGEMASDPLASILLLAMGYDALSMNATSVSKVKWVIRNFSLQSAKEIWQEVRGMRSSQEIRARLELALEGSGLGGLIRAGK